jgi:tubulin--tyrosine ligase
VAADPRSKWILKPSDGCKGDKIVLFDRWGDVSAALTQHAEAWAAGEKPAALVVQKYIENPLLLSRGSRKFDIRCWVCVDAAYAVHLYDQGVLRTASVPYDPDDISNRYSHLTNHCIAATHPDFGRYAPQVAATPDPPVVHAWGGRPGTGRV